MFIENFLNATQFAFFFLIVLLVVYSLWIYFFTSSLITLTRQLPDYIKIDSAGRFVMQKVLPEMLWNFSLPKETSWELSETELSIINYTSHVPLFISAVRYVWFRDLFFTASKNTVVVQDLKSKVYYFKLRACTNAGEGMSSHIVAIDTLACSEAPCPQCQPPEDCKPEVTGSFCCALP